ncbi:hypothetical protein NUW58_g1215 [Xylaria curta]|uniref:Uncharacterized protein n=1 Tax=Xylaria curta TaxID=42375 RepID=A0ACC1PM70_9PEZI|nr:hypothetical protein NUW58_g1215 [Xylaria curta]
MSTELHAPPVLSTPAEYIFEDPTPSSVLSREPPPDRSDHELRSVYEIARTAAEIHKQNWRRVALQFPDAMLADAPWVVGALESEIRKLQDSSNSAELGPGASGDAQQEQKQPRRLYILADTSYSACCVDEIAAEHAASDAVVHYGRACLSPTARLPVLHVFTRQELDHDGVAEAFAREFSDKEAKVIIMADVMFQEHVVPVSDLLRTRGYLHVVATDIIHDPSIFATHHLFHISTPPTSLLLTLSSRLASLCIYPTPASPYTTTISVPDPSATPSMLRRRYGLVLRLATASIIGILVNTLSVKSYMSTISLLREQIAAAGKKSYTIVVGKLNAAKLANFAEIDGWVVVGCWESGLVDQDGLFKPVVTPFELGLALQSDESRIWTGEWWGGIEGVKSTADPDTGSPGPEDAAEVETPEDVEGDIDDEESEPPVFDLRTGKLISNSRPMRVAIRSAPSTTNGTRPNGPTTATQPDSSAIVKRGATEIALINGVASPGAEFLRSKRTWQGLGSDFNPGEDEASTVVEEGRRGVARGPQSNDLVWCFRHCLPIVYSSDVGAPSSVSLATADDMAREHDITRSRSPVIFAVGDHLSSTPMSRRNGISANQPVGVWHLARRTLGIGLLLVTVFLWTTSNFLASYIFSDHTYNKPFFVVYINTSIFAASMIPISIKYIIQNGGFRHVKNQALQAWREHAHRTEGVKTREDSEDPGMGERLLVSDEESLEVHGIPQPAAQLSFLETARFSLEFAMIWFFGNYFASACLEYTSVGSATILTSTSSVWTLIFCALMKIELFSVRKLIGVLASLSGVILISLVDLSGDGNDDGRGNFPHKTQSQIAIGDAMAFFSAIVYGVYVVVMKIRIGSEDRVNMPLFFGLVGTFNILLLWPLFPILHYTGIEPFELPPNGKIWAIILLNSLSSFISDISWAYAMLLTTPLVVTVGLSLNIPLSLIGEMIQYEQYSSFVYWVGAAIVIHLPPAVRTEELEPGAASRADDDTIESKARRVLQQADGVAIMRRYDVPTEAGRQFFEGVVLTDERSFLHDESGAGAVKGNPPVYDVPDLHVDVWREMALNMGGVEHDSRALLHRSKRISGLMQPPQSSRAAGCSIGNSEKQQRASQASDTAKVTSPVRIPLRDETLAIRRLFGYSGKCQLSSAHKAFNLGATLPNSSMKDVLLIGIDVDTYQGYKHLSTDPQLHIGVSILDTRVLHHLILKGPESTRETGALESHQFVVGDSRYCKTASRRFMFGKSQSIPLGEVKAQVESLVCRQGRDNILVFHGDHSDRKALSNLNIQLQPLYIIDNVKAAQYPLGLLYRLGLEAMLDTFGIPYANLHAAGNDAHYALRSALPVDDCGY